jgi:dihydrolipoamide dehydrogenase
MTVADSSLFDVVVIGAGPGGYVAAIRGAQLGLKVALVEEKQLGGVCLNWGCIPTKALLKTSELFYQIGHASDFGIKIGKPTLDFKHVIARSRQVSEKLSQGVKHLLKKNKVTVLDGRAALKAPTNQGHVIAIGNTQSIKAPHVIIATGARARTLPGLEPDGKVIWTAKEAMVPEALPQSVLIIGSGAIGIEFASFYNALGTQVTVVEIQPRILPQEDEEISALAHKSFEAQGIKILTGASVEKLTSSKTGVAATLKTPKGIETLTFEKVIVAVGIVGNVENLGLENTKVKVEKSQILVNEWCQTHEKGIYAIGDVAGAPWLAHKASHEAVLVMEKIAGTDAAHPLNKKAIPGCTYSHPQIASIGMTEAQAKAAGLEVRIGRFPFSANGKALALGEGEGLVKTLFHARTGELLGAHMIGSEVTELIPLFALAITAELTEAELMNTIFPHPTLSEMIHESVLGAFGRAIHI